MTPESRKSRQASRAAKERSLADWKLRREAETPTGKVRRGKPGGKQNKRGYRPPGRKGES